VCFLIFCFIRGGMFVNIIKFKVSVYPQCHLIVPENGWRIVCSGLKKVAANTGSLGTENQYYPSYSSSIKQALVAYDKVKGIFFVICLPSCLQFTCTQDCRHTTCTVYLPHFRRTRHHAIVSNIYNRVKTMWNRIRDKININHPLWYWVEKRIVGWKIKWKGFCASPDTRKTI
jgi:hypothetical protein